MNKSTNLHPILVPVLLLFIQVTEIIYTPHLPAVMRDFSFHAQLAQWTVCIYLLGFSLGAYFWICFSPGRNVRLSFSVSFVILFIATFFCIFTASSTVFLLSRLFQGFGISFCVVLPSIAIHQKVLNTRPSIAFTPVIRAMALIPICGILLGAYLGHIWNWESTFWVIIIWGSILWIMALFFAPQKVPTLSPPKNLKPLSKREKQTRLGHSLVTGGIAGIVWGFYIQAPFIFMNFFQLSSIEYAWYVTSMTIFFGLGALTLNGVSKNYLPTFSIQLGLWVILGGSILWTTYASFTELHLDDRLMDLFMIYCCIAITYYGVGLALPPALTRAIYCIRDPHLKRPSFFSHAFAFYATILTFVLSFFPPKNLLTFPIYTMCVSAISICVFYIFIGLPVTPFSSRHKKPNG